MQRIEAVDASNAQWQVVAAYVLALAQKEGRSPTYSYLKVPEDLLQPTRKLIADMNCDDCFSVIPSTKDFPGSAPPPQTLSAKRGPRSVRMATRAILAVLGLRRLPPRNG
tara:strand:- start:413 stop:742 length:330 start_codon:yes stop_codon:yes gene_type:complete